MAYFIAIVCSLPSENHVIQDLLQRPVAELKRSWGTIWRNSTVKNLSQTCSNTVFHVNFLLCS